jgi:transcriptional regulator with XRE-family HTH domain
VINAALVFRCIVSPSSRVEGNPICYFTNMVANGLEDLYPVSMAGKLSARLAENMRHLREIRGQTQEQMAKLAEMPRATWAHLETGAANPTLAVLDKVATALQVPIEELTGEPRSSGRLHPKASMRTRKQGDGIVQQLLPDPIPGMVIERMEIPPRGRIPGVPHMPGTREYFTCESGEVTLTASGERWRVGPGDVMVFRGDQRHSYANPGDRPAVGYSVVLLARAS